MRFKLYQRNNRLLLVKLFQKSKIKFFILIQKSQSRDSIEALKEDFDCKVKKQKELKVTFDAASKDLDAKKEEYNIYVNYLYFKFDKCEKLQ